MFGKTSVGYESGCVTGPLGPTRLPLPAIGVSMDAPALGWKLCRLSEDVMILADGLSESCPKDSWSLIQKHMHGILLRRLGKKRVVYLVRQPSASEEQELHWHSNFNLVTGASVDWLNGSFSSGHTDQTCTIA